MGKWYNPHVGLIKLELCNPALVSSGVGLQGIKTYMKWFKFYGQDWMTDLKIMHMSMEDRLCFLTLMCLASSSDEGGLVRGCTEDALIRLSHIPDCPTEERNPYGAARGCLKRYEALQSVTLLSNGDVTVNNFMRRQSENLSNAERQEKYRKRLKTRVNPSNERYIPQSNDSNARREEKRREKRERAEHTFVSKKTPDNDGLSQNKTDGKNMSSTPSQTAKDFFSKGVIYSEYLELFTKGNLKKELVISEFDKFILYWTELNGSGTKQRWQQQSTFEVKRRLVTWLGKFNSFNKPTKERVVLS